MTLKSFLLIFCLTTYSIITAQNVDFPNGTYMTLQELIARKPSNPYSAYSIIPRQDKDIFMNGGNDYKIEPMDELMPQKTVKNKVFAISIGNKLYVNGKPLDLWNWYCITNLDGDYLFFSGGVCIKSDSHLATNSQPINGGISGGKQALKRYLYSINLKNGQTEILTEKNIETLLKKKDIELSRQFNSEPNKDQVTLIKYFKIAMTP